MARSSEIVYIVDDRRAGRRPAANSDIGEDDVQLAEILGKIREEPLPVVRHGNVGAIPARVGSQFGDCFIQRLLVSAGNRDFSASATKRRAVARPMPLFPPVTRAFLPVSFMIPP
jgi:hypothetical protein